MKIRVTQVKSQIGRTQRLKDTLEGLGLGRIGRTVVKDVNPAILGMVQKVSHLVKVEEA